MSTHDARSRLKVRVRYFANLRERRGTEEELVDLPAGTTAAEAYALLFPAGPEGRLPVMYAVDQAYAAGDTVLDDGVELAFIPPLGGG